MPSPARDLLLSRMSEHVFQEHVLTTAARGGFHGIHIRQSHKTLEALHSRRRAFPRGSDHDDAWGIPDLILVQPAQHRLELVELKTAQGRLGRGQLLWAEWLDGIERVTYRVWTPRDESIIERVLLG